MIDTKDMEAFDDGYTLDGYIAEQPGVYDSLSFRYRPLSPIEERRLAIEKAKLLADKAIAEDEKEIQCELLNIQAVMKNIHWWNLVDKSGKPAVRSVGTVVLAFPQLRLARLMQIVRDGLQSDPLPDGTEPAKTLEELEKNSLPA